MGANEEHFARQYYVTFVDDHTRKVWIYFMKSKSEVFGHFKSFKNHVEKETGMQIECVYAQMVEVSTSHMNLADSWMIKV